MTFEEQTKAFGDPIYLHKQTKLKSGLLELVYENGAIRWIKLGNIEIIRMVYSAVRDQNWGTIEPRIDVETITNQESSFVINLKVSYQSGPVNFVAKYHISGANNKIRFEMFGIAHSSFLKNRIGLCVLHPISDCIGKVGVVGHPDGTKTDFIFPEQISAYQPVKNIQSLVWSPVVGITAKINFCGDIFEMEDQRNWTDASFKTYCTPLDLPFPVEIKKGETVSQVVELIIENELNESIPANESVFFCNPNQVSALPELGTAINPGKESLTNDELTLLRKLPLKHLRVEVNLSRSEFRNMIEKAGKESRLLGCPLFVVLYFSKDFKDEYILFKRLCKEFNLSIAYLLPVGQDHLSFAAFNELEKQIRNDFPGIKLGVGVNAYFAELNRTRPHFNNSDFLSFTICPQVHAFDCASMVENLKTQADVVRSVQALFPGKPVFVSPVSLKQRFSVVATTFETESESDVFSRSFDPRQMSVFAASWTLGSLKFLSQAGAGLVTYYETVGWNGFFQEEYVPDLPVKFSTKTEDIFPVYEVLKEIAGFSGVIYSWSSCPLLFEGLVVKCEDYIKLFLFSFSSEDMEIRLDLGFKWKGCKSLLYTEAPKFSGQKLLLRAWDLLVFIC